ncbi:MAG: 2Fe-2S iron-sulfur cluster-binding protein [Rhodoblastus sp.]|uniref:2Fe-2S iron-sulfur cluster-binding protein n=1 Tax=Rhodoblastus sp. TaxID=1962975 RepID=UPI003F95B4BD
MVKIIFVSSSGEKREVEAEPGMTVMETATKGGIDEIVAECGGACACATCHVYVDDAWTDKTGAKSAMEESMLDFAENVEVNSRLSCQIKVSDQLDGLIVRMPESQH